MTDQIFKLTTEEATDLIKKAKRGSYFAVHIQMDAVVLADDEHCYPSGLRSYLNITRKDALHLVADCLHKKLEEKGGRIRISIHKTMMSGKERLTYWIG